MAHIKAKKEDVQMLVNFTQSRESREYVEDVLPSPVSSLEELNDLCSKLADQSFKRKLVK